MKVNSLGLLCLGQNEDSHPPNAGYLQCKYPYWSQPCDKCRIVIRALAALKSDNTVHWSGTQAFKIARVVLHLHRLMILFPLFPYFFPFLLWATYFILPRVQNSWNFFTAVSLLILLLETVESYCNQKVLQMIWHKKKASSYPLLSQESTNTAGIFKDEGEISPFTLSMHSGYGGKIFLISKLHQLLGPTAPVEVV